MASRTHVGESAAPEKLTRPVLVVAAVICTCVVVSHMFGRSTISILLPAIRQDLVDSNTAAGPLHHRSWSWVSGFGSLGLAALESGLRRPP